MHSSSDQDGYWVLSVDTSGVCSMWQNREPWNTPTQLSQPTSDKGPNAPQQELSFQQMVLKQLDSHKPKKKKKKIEKEP